jgi:hypothetical protein
MTTLQITMPEEIRQKATAVARKQHISLDELMISALMEKLSFLVPDPYLEKRARRATKRGFDKFMAQVPAVPPDDRDRL